MMDELQKRYQQIRGVLNNLANATDGASVSVAMGHELGRSLAYLHSHCAECGCTITSADYAQVYEHECIRVGAAGMAGVEAQPICPACYAHLRHALSAFTPGLLRTQQTYAFMHCLGGPNQSTVNTHSAPHRVGSVPPRLALIDRAARLEAFAQVQTRRAFAPKGKHL